MVAPVTGRDDNEKHPLTLGLTPQDSRGSPGGWKVKSSENLEWVRMEATSPSTFTASLACEIQATSGHHIICIQETWSCFRAAASTHLKSVLTVKLEGVLHSCNAAIVYDLARLGDAFWDLEQAVCGRDKLKVTCSGTTGKRHSKEASEQT